MHIQTVKKYIRRSPYQSIAASLIMTLTFLTIAVFAILAIVSTRIINYFESRPQLSIFFNDTATDKDINSLQDKLKSTGKVTSIKFITREEALQIYKKQNINDDPLVTELVSSDVLPRSIDVQTSDARNLNELANIAKGTEYSKFLEKEGVVFQKDVIKNLIKYTDFARGIGITVITVLVLVSIFIILTIIGIKITVRRDEIEIMKLIGATNWFIRTPFILEGIFYGVVGSTVGFLISFSVLQFYATPNLKTFFGDANILPLDTFTILAVFGSLFVSAIILGAFSSFLAVLRYLK